MSCKKIHHRTYKIIIVKIWIVVEKLLKIPFFNEIAFKSQPVMHTNWSTTYIENMWVQGEGQQFGRSRLRESGVDKEVATTRIDNCDKLCLMRMALNPTEPYTEIGAHCTPYPIEQTALVFPQWPCGIRWFKSESILSFSPHYSCNYGTVPDLNLIRRMTCSQ